MTNILYCIIHTQKQSDRYDNIVKTWAQNNDFIFYSDHEDIENKVVKASNRSDYSSGEEKQINMINILANSEQYSRYNWYFFCDNDTFVNTQNMSKLLQGCDPDKIHGLVASSWPNDPLLNYCGGGAGILVSNKLLIDKMHNNVHTYNTGYGDVALGLSVRNLGIELQHQPTFHSFPPTYYNYTEEDVKKQTTFHYIKDSFLMQGLYENTKSNT
jgi:hypothetical protein